MPEANAEGVFKTVVCTLKLNIAKIRRILFFRRAHLLCERTSRAQNRTVLFLYVKKVGAEKKEKMQEQFCFVRRVERGEWHYHGRGAYGID